MPNAVDAIDDALPVTSNSPIAAPTIMPPTSASPALFVSFIGCLGLEPLQVLDGLLACFTLNILLYCGFFIKLLHDWTTAAGVVDKIRVDGARLLTSKFKELTAQENAHKDATALYLTTAVLVKEKAIHIEEIYSKLSPSYLETPWASDMKPNRQSDVSEAIVDATTLTEDEALAAVSKAVTKSDIAMEVDPDLLPLMRSPDQKVALLSACLLVGDTGIANFIQKRVPRIATIYPEVGDLISRIIRFKIQGIYDSLPLDTRCRELLQDCVMPIDIQPIQRGFALTSMDIGRFESLYPEWYTQQVPCSTLDDIAQIKPLLDIVGIRIHRDPAVILMLCRLGAVSLGRLSCSSTDTVSAKAEPINVKDMWMDLTGSLFLPAISLANANSGISTEIEQILNTMTFETRVNIYRRWESTIKLDPELRASFAKTEEAAKDVLHQITMQDVEERGPMFAVLAGSNPLAAYAAVMKQIENPDSVVESLVSACKHTSGLSLDVLSYIIVKHLSKIPPVSKVQRNGAPAEWMQKLGHFCGAMYRQQPKADLHALMTYLVDNICKCNGRDLVVLKELLIRMGSAGDTRHLTATQALMMAGGEALREEAFYDSTSIKKDIDSSRLLQEALIRDGNATRLVLALARRYQECQAYILQVTKDVEARQPPQVSSNKNQAPRPVHIKATGIISDQVQAVLAQLVYFMSTNMPEEYGSLCPSLTDLCGTHKIEPSTAMAIFRPRLRSICHQEQQMMALDSMTSKATPEAVAARRKSKKEAASYPATEEKVWLSSLKSVTQEVFSVLPPAAWAGMTAEFYITFWQLSFGDIFVPEEQYRLKIQEQKAAMAAAMDQNCRNNSTEDQAQQITEQDRLDRATGRLKAEMEAQANNKMIVMERLEREKEHWFEGLSEDGSISEVVRHCIIPRAKTSSVDALFCFKYLDILHAIDTPNFSRLTLYDKLFDELDNIVACSTKGEAGNIGVLLQEILQRLDKWRKIKAIYEREGRSRRSFDLPGFRGREPPEYIEDMTKADYLDHKIFQKALYGWHNKIAETLETSLKSGQHVRARNSLIILDKVAACFPVLLCHGERLSKLASNIATNSAKGDLEWMANDYLVKAKESQSWIGSNDFFRGKPGSLKSSSASAFGAVQINRKRSLPEVAPGSDPKSEVTTKIVRQRDGSYSLRLVCSTTMNSNTNKITNTTHTISIAAKNQQIARRDDDNNNKDQPAKDESSDSDQARGPSTSSLGHKRPREEIDLRDPTDPASKIARAREEHRIARSERHNQNHNRQARCPRDSKDQQESIHPKKVARKDVSGSEAGENANSASRKRGRDALGISDCSDDVLRSQAQTASSDSTRNKRDGRQDTRDFNNSRDAADSYSQKKPRHHVSQDPRSSPHRLDQHVYPEGQDMRDRVGYHHSSHVVPDSRGLWDHWRQHDSRYYMGKKGQRDSEAYRDNKDRLYSNENHGARGNKYSKDCYLKDGQYPRSTRQHGDTRDDRRFGDTRDAGADYRNRDGNYRDHPKGNRV